MEQRSIIIEISGMKNRTCRMAVEFALKAIPDVWVVSVGHGRATVIAPPHLEAKMRQAIAAAVYPVNRVMPPQDGRPASGESVEVK